MAKWQNAFEGDPPALKAEFIDLDPDRFFVRVKNVAANTDAATKQKVTIKLSTDSPGTDYDDDPTGIELTETGVDTGVFESKSLMLMGDDKDDDHEANGVGAEDLLNDRSHKIALGGTVKVEYEPAGAPGMKDSDTAEVPVEKTLTLPVIYILRDTVGGAAVTTEAAVEADVKWANERYAQAGILIKVTEIKTVDPPPGVDLTDDPPDGSLDEFTTPDLTAEERALFDALDTADKADIIVFYVNRLSEDSTGEQTREGAFPNELDKRVNNVVLAAKGGANQKTFSHELLHVLMNSAHDGSTRQYTFYHLSTPVDDVNQGRRLTTGHADAARDSKFVQ